MQNNTYFYQDKPIFGLDIGFSNIKVMQVDITRKQPAVIGYGVGEFNPQFMKDGVIVDHEGMAKAGLELFKRRMIGEVTTPRVAMTIPAARTYSRVIKLPKLANKELADAVRMEAEQYIPVPVDQLYMDHNIIAQTDKEIELFAVAVPRKIVDSYILFARLLGLEPVAMQTSIEAATRLFIRSEFSDTPTVLVDFGSKSSDITILDKTLIVTSTMTGGGDDFTNRIADKLNVSTAEAQIIKTKYGLSISKKQREITEAIKPMVEQLSKEIRRMIRYYEERSGTERKINQVVTMGGGANMPGLSEALTSNLRLPVRMSDPWHYVQFSKLQPPSNVERSLFVTVAGLALINPREIFT